MPEVLRRARHATSRRVGSGGRRGRCPPPCGPASAHGRRWLAANFLLAARSGRRHSSTTPRQQRRERPTPGYGFQQQLVPGMRPGGAHMPNYFVPVVQQGQQGPRPGIRRSGAGPAQGQQTPQPFQQQVIDHEIQHGMSHQDVDGGGFQVSHCQAAAAAEDYKSITRGCGLLSSPCLPWPPSGPSPIPSAYRLRV